MSLIIYSQWYYMCLPEDYLSAHWQSYCTAALSVYLIIVLLLTVLVFIFIMVLRTLYRLFYEAVQSKLVYAQNDCQNRSMHDKRRYCMINKRVNSMSFL